MTLFCPEILITYSDVTLEGDNSCLISKVISATPHLAINPSSSPFSNHLLLLLIYNDTFTSKLLLLKSSDNTEYLKKRERVLFFLLLLLLPPHLATEGRDVVCPALC